MAIRPRLRPKDEEFSKIVASANSGGGDKPAAGGGKGGGKSVNPMAKKGSADYRKMQEANAPDSFYGYYDQNTGDYVPWYIDMINGGGANQAGPTFEGGFGTARAVGGLLNAAGVSPYGQDRSRAFMPAEAYRGGDTVPFSQAPAAPAPTGVIGAAVSKPVPISAPTQNFSNLSNAAAIRSGLVGYSPQVVAGTLPSPAQPATGYTYPTSTLPAPNIDVGFSDFPAATNESFVTTPTVDAARQRALQLYGPKFNDLLPQTQEQIIARMQAIMAQR